MAGAGDLPGARPAGAERVGARPGQRAHRAAREPGRGRAARHRGHLPQLLLRAAAAAVPGGRLRLSRTGTNRRQRHRRQAHPADGRRRAVPRGARPPARPRARPGPAGRPAAPQRRLGVTGRTAGADPQLPAGVLHPAGGRRHRLRGRGGRPRGADHPAVRDGGQRGAAPGVQGPPRRRRAGPSAGGGGAGHRAARRGAAAPHPGQRPADGRRHGSRHRRARRIRRGDRRPRRLGPHHGGHRAAARRAPADHQIPRVRVELVALAAGAARPGGRGADRRALRRLGRPRRRSARLPRRLLGRRRRRDRGRPGAAAGGPLQPVPRAAGGRPRRAARHRRQGPHRTGVRRARVLGHRGLRPAAADLHRPARRGRRAAVAAEHPRPGPAPGPDPGPGRCGVPVAHDPRRGVLGVLAGRHRGAAPERGDRPCRRPLPPGHRRRLAGAGVRPGDPGGDRPAVGLARPPRRRRDLARRRRHRPGRVQRRRRRQRLHQPDGGPEPACGRRRVRPPARGRRPARGPAGRAAGLAGGRRRGARALRRTAGRARAVRRLHPLRPVELRRASTRASR